MNRSWRQLPVGIYLFYFLTETSTRVPNAKHIGRFLQIVVRVVCTYGSESTATCLSTDVVDLFATQLSDKKYACFSTASKLMSEMLNAVVQHWMTANKHHKGDEPMEVDQTDCHNSPASPDILFRCLISGSLFFDFSVHHSVQKPCQVKLFGSTVCLGYFFVQSCSITFCR